MALRTGFLPVSGNADTLVAGSVIAGTAINLGDNNRQKVQQLSTHVNIDAETTSFTFAFKYQCSNDNATWTDVANGTQNAAAVVLSTGTAGADAAVTRIFPFPESCYAWKYARAALVTGGATGASVDTYAMSYTLRSL